MNYIKHLHIEGFKKFRKLDISFNEKMNILVGENEAGKSTILDAIKTVLNQQYRTADKSVLEIYSMPKWLRILKLIQVLKPYLKF